MTSIPRRVCEDEKQRLTYDTILRKQVETTLATRRARQPLLETEVATASMLEPPPEMMTLIDADNVGNSP